MSLGLSVMIKKGAVFIIRIYQWTISPLIGNSCKFTPSCSEYAAQAISHHGILKGGLLAAKRILRCNPWNDQGGPDPV